MLITYALPNRALSDARSAMSLLCRFAAATIVKFIAAAMKPRGG